MEMLIGTAIVVVAAALIAWQPWRAKWEDFVRPPHDWTAEGEKKNPPRKL